MPSPSVIIRVPKPSNSRGVSSRDASIEQSDGQPFPLDVVSANVFINWDSGVPVLVNLECAGGLAMEAAAGIRFITIGGVVYRLVPVGQETQDAS